MTRLGIDRASRETGPVQVLVLVGPKGCGKTTIGRALERHPRTRFLEVEVIAKRVLAGMGNIIDETYARRAFQAILEEVDSLARTHRIIVLETTGASDETPSFLDALRRRHEVRLIRVRARPETCAARIAARDATRQIDVPVALVREMHERTEALRLAWDLEVANDPPLDEEAIARAFAPLWLLLRH